jgi:hypothetical protein
LLTLIVFGCISFFVGLCFRHRGIEPGPILVLSTIFVSYSSTAFATKDETNSQKQSAVMDESELRKQLQQHHAASCGWALSCCSSAPELAEGVLQINPFDYLKDPFTRLPAAKITQIKEFTPVA